MIYKHPAKFTEALFPVMAKYLEGYNRILDPMAGIGGVFKLAEYLADVQISAVELEPEWASMDERIYCGDARYLPWPDGYFDAIVCSPAYANRLSDKLSPPGRWQHTRITYADYLGRNLSRGSGAALAWGAAYKELHVQVWTECSRVLRPNGRFVLNCKNHIRNKEEQAVTEWHVDALIQLGFSQKFWERVDVRGMRRGENYDARVNHENIVVLDKGVSHVAPLPRWKFDSERV